MSVAVHDYFCIGKSFMQPLGCGTAELVSMRHYDDESVQVDSGDLGALRANFEPIDVAVHCGDRRQHTQLAQQICGTDISTMEYVIHL